jgi:GNAT superfamily N-acetyltransferase
MLAMDIRFLDPHVASEADLRAVYQLDTRLRTERDPHEPGRSFNRFVAAMRNPPPVVTMRRWATFVGPEAVGHLEAGISNMENNQHLMQVGLAVSPEWRQRGIGTALLHRAVDWARNEGKSVLVSETAGSVPAGEAFARRIGATPVLVMQTNVLELAGVDRSMLRDWIKRAGERASGYDLKWWLGPIPDESLAEAATMLDLANDIPQGDLDMEDIHVTPEQVRQIEDSYVASGDIHWTCYVRERATGVIAGFSDLLFSPEDPSVIRQVGTAVDSAHRQRGLGRWVKAAMLERVLTEIPEATRITTGNADMNEAMLSINRELGFQPSKSTTVWQVPLETVEHALPDTPTAAIS